MSDWNRETGGIAMSNRSSSHKGAKWHHWRKWRKWVLPLWLAVLACGSATSLAGDDHDRARRALEAGEVLPLQAILVRVERALPGQVIDVELERDDDHERDHGNNKKIDRWIYKIKMLRTGGVLVKLKVDARNGTIIGKKNKGGNEAEPKQKNIRNGR